MFEALHTNKGHGMGMGLKRPLGHLCLEVAVELAQFARLRQRAILAAGSHQKVHLR
jgi:hypothetical protein